MLSLRAEDVSFSYGNGDVLSSVSFSVEGPGTLAVLGSNGSGKSTLARLIDGLLPLRRGSITVCGIPVMDRSRIHELRKHIGIIFQDPDSQFVSPVLEEDTAFGPENFGFSGEEVSLRVDSALCETGLSAFRKRSPQSLSGGEKSSSLRTALMRLLLRIMSCFFLVAGCCLMVLLMRYCRMRIS